MKKTKLLSIPLLLFFTFIILQSNLPAAGDIEKSNYIIIFQVNEYNSKLDDAVEYLYKNVIKPQDRLTIITPVKAYEISQKTRQAQTVEKLVKLTSNILKRDIVNGSSSYHQILTQMTQMIVDIDNGVGESAGSSSGKGTGNMDTNDLKNHLVTYRQLLAEMRNLRKLNETLFLKMAEMYKKLTGKNYIYIIYQKELRIVPDRDVMENLRNNPDLRFDVIDVFIKDEGEEFLDVKKVVLSRSNRFNF